MAIPRPYIRNHKKIVLIYARVFIILFLSSLLVTLAFHAY
ncbi:hypothetical protein HMPREF3224_02106 [Anaerococcus hydrogenalis]|nr:hypothetical protein HMPREF3224_02106 [Anaerococcus hydrogenalis]